MTVVPEISEKVLAYALGFVRKAIDQTRPRRAAGEGEQQAQKLTLSELMAYCDETNEEKIRAYHGAGTRLQKIVCLAMAAAAVLFVVSVFTGTATAATGHGPPAFGPLARSPKSHCPMFIPAQSVGDGTLRRSGEIKFLRSKSIADNDPSQPRT